MESNVQASIKMKNRISVDKAISLLGTHPKEVLATLRYIYEKAPYMYNEVCCSIT